MPTRAQKRWSGRLRTAGALLLLAGAVAAGDSLLPRGGDPVFGVSRPERGLVAAAAFASAGGVLFWLGRRWR